MSQSALNQANGRLKRDRIPVRIGDRSGRLYLEATLPPAPGSQKLLWHQQKIHLKLSIRPDTISIAEKKARILAQELAANSFDWDDWRTQRNTSAIEDTKNVREWIEALRLNYFSLRAETPKSLRTWKDYQAVLNRLPQAKSLSSDLLLSLVLETEPDTKTRQRTCLVLSMLAKFSGLEIDLSPYRGKYGRNLLTPRDLPSDIQIEEAREKITSEEWQWLFGILATYGLRPHEAMLCDLSQFPRLDVLDGKTGARFCYPCPETWAIDWNLERVARPKISGPDNSALGSRISHAFRRFEIPFPPSVLRHCWAVRASKYYTVEEAAKQMGHAPSLHLDHYQRWISDRHIRASFERTREPSDKRQ